jgi:hypothetical protein
MGGPKPMSMHLVVSTVVDGSESSRLSLTRPWPLGSFGASLYLRTHRRWLHLALEPVTPTPPGMCHSAGFWSSTSISPNYPTIAKTAH